MARVVLTMAIEDFNPRAISEAIGGLVSYLESLASVAPPESLVETESDLTPDTGAAPGSGQVDLGAAELLQLVNQGQPQPAEIQIPQVEVVAVELPDAPNDPTSTESVADYATAIAAGVRNTLLAMQNATQASIRALVEQLRPQQQDTPQADTRMADKLVEVLSRIESVLRDHDLRLQERQEIGRKDDGGVRERLADVIRFLQDRYNMGPPPRVTSDFGLDSLARDIAEEFERQDPETASVGGNATKIGKHIFVHESQDSMPILLPEESSFFATIDDSAAMDGEDNRWDYGWTEVEKATAGASGTWSAPTSGRSGTTTSTPAWNFIETINDDAGVQGNGVDIDGADFPAGFSVQPVPDNTLVRMHEVIVDGTTEYWFQYENGIDGTCEAEE